MDRRQFEAKIVAKAWRDPGFLHALKADPRGTLTAELEAVHSGAKLPPNLQVSVLEEAPDHIYLVIPNRPKSLDAALDEATLETVAAGGSGYTPPESSELQIMLQVTAEVSTVVEVVASP